MKCADKTVIIGGYEFYVKFVNKEEIPRCVGQTEFDTRLIKIRDDLDKTATKITVTHEIIHAVLATQGRVYQKKFDIEEVCEFIAYRLDEINRVVKDIMEEEE